MLDQLARHQRFETLDLFQEYVGVWIHVCMCACVHLSVFVRNQYLSHVLIILCIFTQLNFATKHRIDRTRYVQRGGNSSIRETSFALNRLQPFTKYNITVVPFMGKAKGPAAITTCAFQPPDFSECHNTEYASCIHMNYLCFQLASN